MAYITCGAALGQKIVVNAPNIGGNMKEVTSISIDGQVVATGNPVPVPWTSAVLSPTSHSVAVVTDNGTFPFTVAIPTPAVPSQPAAPDPNSPATVLTLTATYGDSSVSVDAKKKIHVSLGSHGADLVIKKLGDQAAVPLTGSGNTRKTHVLDPGQYTVEFTAGDEVHETTVTVGDLPEIMPKR